MSVAVFVGNMAENVPDSQNNCAMCPTFSRTIALSLSRHWSVDFFNDLLLKILPVGVQCTLSLRSSRLEIRMRYMLCCRASHGVVNWGVWGLYRRLHTNFYEKYFVYIWMNGIVCVVSVKKSLRCYNVVLWFLLQLGSFTNLVICINVLNIATIKLSHIHNWLLFHM